MPMSTFQNTTRNIGLVFSGGGGKGAYEIGVWKALDLLGITPNIGGVSGASVGALNAALFAQGDLLTAEAVWKSISPEAVITLNGPFSGLQRFLDLFDKEIEKYEVTVQKARTFNRPAETVRRIFYQEEDAVEYGRSEYHAGHTVTIRQIRYLVNWMEN